jgi:hypothetical protein
VSKIVVTFEIERQEPRREDERYPEKTTLAKFEVETEAQLAIAVYQEALTRLTAPTVKVETKS